MYNSLMETDKNPMPDFHLFPRVEKAGQCIKKLVSLLSLDASSIGVNRGGGPMLDRQLYDEVDRHGFLYEGEEVGHGPDVETV